MAATFRLVAEFRANPRLRWGLWLILTILGWNGVLLLQERAEQARRDYAAAAGRLARAREVAGDDIWLERLQQARVTQARFEDRLWHADSPGLAQASFQDWLGQAARGANLGNPRITVTLQAGEAEGKEARNFWKVTARLTGDFHPGRLETFLKTVGEHKQQVVVESLAIRTLNTAPRFEMQLAAPFRPAQASARPEAS